MSASDQIQDMYARLQALELKLQEFRGTLDVTEEEAKEMAVSFRQMELVAMRYLAIVRRMNLPDDAQRMINILTRLMVLMRMLQMTMAALMPGGAGILVGLAMLGTSLMAANDTIGMMAETR